MQPEIAAMIVDAAGSFSASKGSDKLVSPKLSKAFQEAFPPEVIAKIRWFPAVPAGLEEMEGKVSTRSPRAIEEDKAAAGASRAGRHAPNERRPLAMTGGGKSEQGFGTPMANDLECRELVKSYGPFLAVAGVSLAVPKGSFFSILGPSGAADEPDADDRRLRRADLGRDPHRRPLDARRSAERRPANMVFQHLALFPMMSVADNIGYGLRRRGMARARSPAGSARCSSASAFPTRLRSGSTNSPVGRSSALAIARCMVLEPTVLLLDEPLGALDLKLREHMKVELKQLQHQFGTTFVYITHDQSERS